MKMRCLTVAVAITFLSASAYAGMSPECKSAQDNAKWQIHSQGLDVNDTADGAYEAAVKSRRMYKIVLDGITGVCPQGTVDYYQSQYNKAHTSACQFSATDTICQDVSARKREEEQQAQQEADAKQLEAQMEVCHKENERRVYSEEDHHLGNLARIKSLVSQGYCPDTEFTRDWIARAEKDEAESRARSEAHNQQMIQRSRGYEDEDEAMDGGGFMSGMGSILAPLAGAAGAVLLQQQVPQGSGGSSDPCRSAGMYNSMCNKMLNR